jgi:hypothetical protein
MKKLKYPLFLMGLASVLMCSASVQAIAKCPKNIPLTVVEEILDSKMVGDKVAPVIQGGYVYELKIASLGFDGLRVKLSSKTALSTEFPSYSSLGATNQTKTVLDPFKIGADVKVEFGESMGGDLCGYKITRAGKPIYKNSEDLVVFKIVERTLPTPPSPGSKL